MNKKKLNRLVKIIQDNLGCVAIIDNDRWEITKPEPVDFNLWADDRQEQWWEKDAILATSNEFSALGDNVYGQGVLKALASIVGINIESV